MRASCSLTRSWELAQTGPTQPTQPWQKARRGESTRLRVASERAGTLRNGLAGRDRGDRVLSGPLCAARRTKPDRPDPVAALESRSRAHQGSTRRARFRGACCQISVCHSSPSLPPSGAPRRAPEGQERRRPTTHGSSTPSIISANLRTNLIRISHPIADSAMDHDIPRSNPRVV
jgi:hypothetical protein